MKHTKALWEIENIWIFTKLRLILENRITTVSNLISLMWQNSTTKVVRKGNKVNGESVMTAFDRRHKLFQPQNFFCFSIWVIFYEHSRITGLQRKGEGISLTPHYHFYTLHRHLDNSRTITAGNSPLHIASSRTRAGNLWFPIASR